MTQSNGDPPRDSALEAFRRLLADAQTGGEPKLDAIAALLQRTVFVATLPDGEGFRTLMNATGIEALPIFSDPSELESAGRRQGWVLSDGSMPFREVGSREALRRALSENLGFVVIDMAAEHALELSQSEFEPLLSSARRGEAGPYAAAGLVSSTLVRPNQPAESGYRRATVKLFASDLSSSARRSSIPPAPTSKPPETGSLRPPRVPSVPPGMGLSPPTRSMTPAGTWASGMNAPAATGGSVAPATAGRSRSSTTRPPPPMFSEELEPSAPDTMLAPLPSAPSDEVLDALAEVLRGYPEVEWACLALARSPESDTARPAVALRVDPRFRARVAEIARRLARAAEPAFPALDAVLLDDQAVIRNARNDALMFYPWRR